MTFTYRGEIRETMPDGTVIEADTYERGDHQWSWSARVTWYGVDDPDGDNMGVNTSPRKSGPHIVASEAEAQRECVAWIRAHLPVPS